LLPPEFIQKRSGRRFSPSSRSIEIDELPQAARWLVWKKTMMRHPAKFCKSNRVAEEIAFDQGKESREREPGKSNLLQKPLQLPSLRLRFGLASVSPPVRIVSDHRCNSIRNAQETNQHQSRYHSVGDHFFSVTRQLQRS